MRPYTSSAARSRTPPLVYRRSENVLPSLSTSAQYGASPQELKSSLQYPTSLQISSAQSTKIPSSLATTSSSYGTLNYVSNPFSTSSSSCSPSFDSASSRSSVVRTTDRLENSLGRSTTSQTYGCYSTTSCQTRPTESEECNRLLAQDAEDAALQREEAALKAKLTELRMEHQILDDEQFQLGKGWASLFEREQRYYTEPVPDCSLDTIQSEQRCLALQEQVNHANTHLERIRSQLAQHEYVIEEQKKISQDIESLRLSLENFEKRRQNCLSRSGQFFDVESKRATEAQRAVLNIDDQLVHQKPDVLSSVLTARVSEGAKLSSTQKGTATVHIKQLQNSKGLWGQEGAYPHNVDEEESHDMTSSTMGLSTSIPESEIPEDQRLSSCHNTLQESICIQLNDDEESSNDNFSRMIGGPSTVISLNAQPDYTFPSKKRKKVDFYEP